MYILISEKKKMEYGYTTLFLIRNTSKKLINKENRIYYLFKEIFGDKQRILFWIVLDFIDGRAKNCSNFL